MPTTDSLPRRATAADRSGSPDHAELEKASSASDPILRKPTFRMRPVADDEPQDWWFASTAIPLLAATSGPLANVMSIAALATSWRVDYDPGFIGQDVHAKGFADPKWCVGLNAASLVCGVAGNIFLLFNFTRRIKCKPSFRLIYVLH